MLHENQIHNGKTDDLQQIIAMKGCFIVYGYHKGNEIQIIESKQDTDLGILSFEHKRQQVAQFIGIVHIVGCKKNGFGTISFRLFF